ncbi:hypothetical protein [Agrobacterium tumefaciens]|uniref:hypothetical protein n=1 Tax=Agrobacterium tumefaciens TaxID=358 RepID=UPI001574136A|nr:hypothetical protein [Agrobacterium tumefaciens]NSX90263.1 hypothetical protein [Agrobacterium tumefaciens]
MTSTETLTEIRQAAMDVLENLGGDGEPQPVEELNALREVLAEHRNLRGDTTDADLRNLFLCAEAMLLNTGIGVMRKGPGHEYPPTESCLDNMRAALDATAPRVTTAFKM